MSFLTTKNKNNTKANTPEKQADDLFKQFGNFRKELNRKYQEDNPILQSSPNKNQSNSNQFDQMFNKQQNSYLGQKSQSHNQRNLISQTIEAFQQELREVNIQLPQKYSQIIGSANRETQNKSLNQQQLHSPKTSIFQFSQQSTQNNRKHEYQIKTTRNNQKDNEEELNQQTNLHRKKLSTPSAKIIRKGQQDSSQQPNILETLYQQRLKTSQGIQQIQQNYRIEPSTRSIPNLLDINKVLQLQGVLVDAKDSEIKDIPKNYVEELIKLSSVIMFRIKNSNFYRR